jgi:hypothetical protein
MIEQINVLESTGSWNYRARFIVVTAIAATVPIQQLGSKIFEKMWKNYSVMHVLLLISVTNLKVNDTIVSNLTPHKNYSQVKLQLYTWFPYTSDTHCENPHVVLIDRWTSKGEFVLNANLFPEKVPKTFHGCKSNVTTFIYPPAVMKTVDSKFTGIEINYLLITLKKLNLTPEYNEIPFKYKSHYEQFSYAINELEPASLDVSIGILPVGGSNVSAEATIPYFDFKVKWYVPCPNPASRWTCMFKIFSLHVWICFCFFLVVAVITMWLLARYAKNNNVRESMNYMTVMYCAYNVWAMTTGISVHEKPISISLRIFFIVWVWHSLAMTTVFQTYFVGFLVNPGFEKSISTLNDIIESGIEYGFMGDMDRIQFSDSIYDIIKKHLKQCPSLFKCLERVIRNKDFATVSDDFHAEYLSTRLLFYDIRTPVCSLPSDIMRYSVSTYMAKGNPLLHRFNEIIRYLLEAGLFGKWKNDFISNTRSAGHPIENDDANFEGITENDFNGDYVSYSLFHLQVIFYILLLGYTFSISVLVGEILYYRTHGSKEKSAS